MGLKLKRKTKPKLKVKPKQKKKPVSSKFEHSRTAERSPVHGKRRVMPWKGVDLPVRGFDVMPHSHASVEVTLTTKDGRHTHTISAAKSCDNCADKSCPDRKYESLSGMSCITGLGLNSWDEGEIAVMRGWWRPRKKALTKVVPRETIERQESIDNGTFGSTKTDEDDHVHESKQEKKRRMARERRMRRKGVDPESTTSSVPKKKLTKKKPKKKLFRKK